MTNDLLPAYIALIRHELALPSGADALAELEARLSPPDRSARPPYRAPGIVRLRRALRRIDAGKAPGSTLEEFREDLRFLKLFGPDEPAVAREAMQRLLADVMGSPTEPGKVRKQPSPAAKPESAMVVPFRRRSSKKTEGS